MAKSFRIFPIWVLLQLGISCNNTDSLPPGKTNTESQDNLPETENISASEDDMELKEKNTQANSDDTKAPAQLRFIEGQFFTFALAPGWKVTEDGQFAVVTVAPDQKAVTIIVGNAGMPANYSPGQYIFDRLSGVGYQQVRLGQPRQARPISGCTYATEFDYSYMVNGEPCRGIARCHVAPSYDMCTMIMTAAASVETQWEKYAGWLPDVAALGQAKNGAAFGARGIMEQNIRNSTAYAEAARNYREWSAKNWQEVTDDRNRSVDRRNEQFRENIGAVQTYINPYDPEQPIELSSQYKYYWIDRQGKTWGTNDATENPNNGSTKNWLRMDRKNK